uniref:Glucose-methanol-choline oxidoreductase N-terminal domain-containing protein n=1 Tax=Bionectria ochroleuca TaxID=29856 RepID=A0A8H7N1H0_BIOOC
MRLQYLLAFGIGLVGLTAAVELSGYEYIVTLLIEAGDDQGANNNYTVPAYSALASEDGSMAWNFFVRHYADDERQALDYKTSYETVDGGLYTGLDPPEGSKMLGTLYPRTGTLGGCTAHNALIAIYPYRSDFEYISRLTGDQTWDPKNMRKYFDPQLLSLFLGGASGLGNLTDSVFNLATLLAGDANADSPLRDKSPGYYQIPISTDKASRIGPREFVVSVRDAKNSDGSKKYPLDVRMQCHVTKVVFDESEDPPRAIGVEFLDGAYLYAASPRSKNAGPGKPGSAMASREVIISGGTYNSPQILKLSGVGPKEELERFGIPVIVNLPGVGANLQDHYEVAVQGRTPKDFVALDGCTFGFDGLEDSCLERWENPVLGDHGTYASSGLGVTMFYPSTATAAGDYDTFIFGGPVNFRGYFPQYSINVTVEHDWFTWAILKGQPRNTAGTVTLASADPLDVPVITYNYFDTGSGDSSADLQAISEAIRLARDAFDRQPVPIREELPGENVQSQEDIEQYIKDTAWGHHASSTCPIGTDDDPMAVLDSKFRVRGVKGLRVVDASVYPRIPGTFTAVSTFIAAEKAADDILDELD